MSDFRKLNAQEKNGKEKMELRQDNSQIILVVDDASVDLEIMTDILTRGGYQVRPVSSGPMALRSVALELPDLILLDVKMPDMDGYEVCRCLKFDEYSRGIPVIFISVLDETADKVEGFNAGGVDYITKPFQTEEVLARVKIHLDLRSLQKQLELRNIQLQQEITERVLAEKALKRRERELESKSRNLEELNTALQVLLKQREVDKDDFEGRTLANIRELIIPHIEQLKKSNLKANEMVYVSLIESNLKDILSPLSYRLSSKYMTFTPKEIQVIKLIKEGKATIEIAKLLNTSPGTIEFHRNNIRTKLKLKNKRANLRSYLMTLT